jgi:hypothetical protein
MAQVETKRMFSKLTIVALAAGVLGVPLTWLASTSPVLCDLVHNCYPELPGYAAIVGSVVLAIAIALLFFFGRNAYRVRTVRVIAIAVIVLSVTIPIITYSLTSYTTQWHLVQRP